MQHNQVDEHVQADYAPERFQNAPRYNQTLVHSENVSKYRRCCSTEGETEIPVPDAPASSKQQPEHYCCPSDQSIPSKQTAPGI